MTMINRPDLHNDVLESFQKFFNDALLYENITWVINIDVISKLPYTFEETKSNFTEQVNKLYPSSKIIFLPKSINPSFQLSVKKLIYYLDDNIKIGDQTFWLEDDWRYIGHVNYDNVKDYLDDYTSFHMYWKCREDNLYPIIRGYYESLNFINTVKIFDDKNEDPEVRLMKYYPKIQQSFNIYVIKQKLEDIYVTGGMRSNMKRYEQLKSNIVNVLDLEEISKSSDNKIRHIVYNKIMSKDLGKIYMSKLNLRKWASGDDPSRYYEIKN
jgi:hypothetical protein